jgi:hypothetical protein
MKDIIEEFAAKVKQLEEQGADVRVAAAEDIPLKDLIGILLGNPNGTLAAIVALAKAHPITVIGAMDDLKELEIKEETNLVLLTRCMALGHSIMAWHVTEEGQEIYRRAMAEAEKESENAIKQ